MKTHQHSLIIFTAIIALIYSSCKKEIISTPPDRQPSSALANRNGTDDFALTTSDIKIENGMYVFPSYQSVQLVLGSLDALLNDAEMNTQALTALGYSSANIKEAPDEPVLELFNRRFSVPTLRQKCDAIDQAEDLGLATEAEMDNVVIWDPILGSIINQNNEVQIGQLMYKYIDENRTLVFRSDAQLLDIVRSAPDPYALPDQANLFKIDARKPEDLALYEKIEAANLNGDCMFDVDWSHDGNQFFFHSISFFPIGGHVLWKIKDGNGTVLQTQNGLSTFNFLIPNGATYPLSVSIESEGCDPHVELFAQSAPSAGYDCSAFTFDYAFTGNTSQQVVRFTIPPNTPTVYWDFNADGTTDYVSLPTGSGGGSFTHTYPDDNGFTQYTACATVHAELCTNTVCKEIGAVGCGIKNKQLSDKKYYVPLARYCKLKFGLKNPLFSESRFFAKIKNYVYGNGSNEEAANRLSIYLNAAGNNVIGDLRYLNPVQSGGCTPIDQIAIADAFNVWKLDVSRKLQKNSTMRKADLHCVFEILEYVDPIFLPSGSSDPFFYRFEL